MKRRNLLLAALLAVALLTGIVWLLLRLREPVYQGKRLSEWLDISLDPDNYNRLHPKQPPVQTRAQAKEAVVQIGTTAIPTLLRLLRARDSSVKLKLIALAQKQHFAKINFVPAEKLNQEAEAGFLWLGAAASNAVPALINLYEEKISEKSQMSTSRSLGFIGPAASAAVPMLLATIADTNANHLLRAYSAEALGEIHAEPELVVPALIKCLGHSDPSIVRQSANRALYSFGTSARAAVPALVYLLKDPDPSTRTSAANALGRIDPEAAAEAGIQ